MNVQTAASKCIGSGISVIPVGTDKRPAVIDGTRISWKEYQSRLMNEAEITAYFMEGVGMAAICGKASGNLECIDFDLKGKYFTAWEALVSNHGGEELLKKVYTQKSQSGGRHIMYRAQNPVSGNMKLAESVRRETWIETRGEGGYVVLAPSPGYSALSGRLNQLPVLTDDERDLLLSCARYLTEHVEEISNPCAPGGDRPGDEFNRRASWDEVLTPHGWQFARKSGPRGHWVRPGKKVRDGISGTTGNGPKDLLFIHSSNCGVLEVNRSYNKFSAYAMLNHSGNYNEAARQLVKDGYGTVRIGVPAAPERLPQHGVTKVSRRPQRRVLETVEPGLPKFLWEPYIRAGQINLLDAKGGAGKTTFLLGLASSLSNGFLPNGEKVEPCKTLYYGGEDESSEIRMVVNRAQGNSALIEIIDRPFTLNQEGLSWLEEDIRESGAKLVCFDALKYYLAGVIRNQLDDMEVAPHLEALREVARRTGCAIVNVRHWRKNPDLTQLESAGQGNEQWRNSHRSQLVILRHPDIHGLSICLHLKANLLTELGPPFGFSNLNGVFGWVMNPDVSFLNPDGPKGAGRPPKQLEACMDAMRGVMLPGERMPVAQVLTRLEELGYPKATVYRAKDGLGIISSPVKHAPGVTTTWHIPDPYEDNLPYWNND